MHDRRNFYRVLRVQPDAPAEVIEASYRTLMQRLRMHPDLGGDHLQAALINEAFATLRDPARRHEYDLTLATRLDEPRHAAGPATAPAPGTASPRAPEPAPEPAVATCRALATIGAPVWAGRDAAAEAIMPSVLAETAESAEPAPLIHASMPCPFCGTRHSVRAAQRPDARCATCRSPLHTIATLDLRGDPATQRAVERLDRRMPVQLEVSWPRSVSLAATSEDLSIHGMGLLVPARLTIGTCLKITCEFCDAVGEVTYVQARTSPRQTIWRTGVRFLTISVNRPRGGLVSVKA